MSSSSESPASNSLTNGSSLLDEASTQMKGEEEDEKKIERKKSRKREPHVLKFNSRL
jgi:hypothetical protein